jgi:tRNA 2-thiouridine synthesizing protein D
LPGKLLIFLCDSPFQHESVDQAYEIAQAALRKGHNVNIYLMMDGVYDPITSQNGAPINMRSVSEKFADLMSKGVRITACRVCMEIRGVGEKMLPKGFDVGGTFDLSEMMSESDVVINFVERN